MTHHRRQKSLSCVRACAYAFLSVKSLICVRACACACAFLTERIVRLIDVFEVSKDGFCTVLEYCDGGDLEQVNTCENTRLLHACFASTTDLVFTHMFHELTLLYRGF
jgi:hypothetical protein